MDELWRSDVSRVDLAQGSVEYRCWGPSPHAGPAIVLLHEGLGCLALWRDVPDRLAEITGCGVLAYSRYGYGDSDTIKLPRPLDYMTREARVLAELIERFGLNDHYLLGHSDGGSIAALYAAQTNRPGLKKLILLAPHFFVEPCCVSAITTAREAFEAEGLRERLARYHSHVDAAFRGWCDLWLDTGFIDGWNIEHCADEIDMPVMALQGSDDEYGTAAQYRAWQDHPAFDLHILNKCGHDPFRDQRDRSLELVSTFVGA